MTERNSQGGSHVRRQRNQRRHNARVLAMQILYESVVTGHSTAEILVRTSVQGGTPEETLAYTSDLLTGIRAQRHNIDAEIEDAAPAFAIEDIAPIDHAILQTGIFEILYGDDVPPRAAVNEAVSIAREFGGDSSARFVNGVLGTIIDRRRPEARRPRPKAAS
jgi:transcription antitermination protein NusB